MKVYKCALCGKTFTRGCSLASHIIYKHKEEMSLKEYKRKFGIKPIELEEAPELEEEEMLARGDWEHSL